MDQAEQLRKLVGQQIQHSGSTRVIAVTSGKGGVGKTSRYWLVQMHLSFMTLTDSHWI